MRELPRLPPAEPVRGLDEVGRLTELGASPGTSLP
jgi:hypothetical protein